MPVHFKVEPCANELCRWPHVEVMYYEEQPVFDPVGRYCNPCREMFMTLFASPYWRKAEEESKREQERSKQNINRLKPGADYFGD